jgi:lipoate-protein ligase A
VSTAWRLIIENGPVKGAWNMALDRAIQVSHEAGEVPPTLRLYRWERPTVTLGHFQAADSVDLAYCDQHGIDVVRRFTGGRGVLHDDEVTYAIVAGISDGIPRGVAASYRLLCSGLAEAYGLLGVDAGLTALPRGDRASAACYLHATAADLSVDARKLSGSAQVWLGSTVMQHGSFTRSRDIERDAAVFKLQNGAGDRLRDHTATLAELLPTVPSYDEIISAASEGVARALGIELVVGELSQAEIKHAEELLPLVSRDSHGRRARQLP